MVPGLYDTDWWSTIDKINDAVSHPDFEKTIHNPWFLVVSAAVLLFGALRGKKVLLTCYIAAIVIWGIVDKTILRDTTQGAGSANIVVFAGLVVAAAAVAIYFLLIKD